MSFYYLFVCRLIDRLIVNLCTIWVKGLFCKKIENTGKSIISVDKGSSR